MSLSVIQKGLLLLILPLIFQLAFLLVVIQLQRGTVEAERLAVHTQEVIARAQAIQSLVSDAHGSIRGYVVAQDASFLEPHHRAVRETPDAFEQLIHLTSDNPPQSEVVRSMRSAADSLLLWQTGLESQVRTGRAAEAANAIRSGQGRMQMDEFRTTTNHFLVEEERLARERAIDLEGTRRRFNILLASGAIASVLFTFLLAMVYQRRIAKRFAIVEANTHRYAAGEPLAEPLGGTDELARLDDAFRRMVARLEAASQRIHDLYDNAPCGYHSVDPDGIVIAANRTELRWLQLDAEQVIGKRRFSEFVAPESAAAYHETFASVRENGHASDVQLELIRRDGSRLHVLLNSTGVCDETGRYLRSRTILTDMTERRRAEDAVRALNADLERIVSDRTADLESANRDLAQKNNENEMFVYSVSHDLRSPLVNLQGFSKELDKGRTAVAGLLEEEAVPETVRERGRVLLDGKIAKSITFIQSAVLRLAGIIDALLRLSRAGRVEYRLEMLDMNAILKQVLNAAQGTIQERGATVEVEALPTVRGDRTAVEQLFGNLVGNALTYLDPARPGRIVVGCRPAESPGQHCYFVRDNGLGIDPGHQKKIFQAFQRAHPGVGGGEGLGLAIVARVAERHRGRVWVESQPGAGSTFFVVLPAAE